MIKKYVGVCVGIVGFLLLAHSINGCKIKFLNDSQSKIAVVDMVTHNLKHLQHGEEKQFSTCNKHAYIYVYVKNIHADGYTLRFGVRQIDCPTEGIIPQLGFLDLENQTQATRFFTVTDYN